MSTLTLEIKKIPDLSLNKYQSLSDTGTEGLLKRHNNFLRQWHGICKECNASMHLFYNFEAKGILGERLHIYLIFQADDQNLLTLKTLIKFSPLSDFYHFEETVLPNNKYSGGATLLKNERIADIFHKLSSEQRSYYYVPKWEMNEEVRLYDLYKILEAIGRISPEDSCAYRIDLYSASLSQLTRDRFTPIIKSLQGDNDIQIVRDDVNNSKDVYISDVEKVYEEWLTSIETSPHFQVNIYSFAKTSLQARIILNAVGSEALSEGNFSLANIKPENDGNFYSKTRMGREPENYSRYQKDSILNSWATTYLLSEVEAFFKLPILFDGEVIEIPKETIPEKVDNGIYIGKDENGFDVNFQISDLPRHAFFTGTPGSGKTNTMLHIVTQLRKQNIPFLVLEPAKKEYRELLGYSENRDIHLFSPHLQSKFPLRMNPFEFPKGTRVSEHINSLLEVFEGSFTLEGPTYKFLSSSIQKSYEDYGWDIEDINEKNTNLEYPKMMDIYKNLENLIEQSSYDGELKGNIRSFLQVRLGGLMERDAGELFDSSISTIRPEEWININAIIELEILPENAKNFFVLLICHYILETLRAYPRDGVDANGNLLPVRHAIFIEEAHNIIAPSSIQQGADSINPKVSATAYIVKMLAEVRALREAIIVADQLPTALANEVTKNTGLKLVHRLTAQDDKEQIGTTISASPLQLEQMSTFSKGKALIYHEKTMKPFLVQVAEWIKPNINFDFSDDEQLYCEIANEDFIYNSVCIAIDSIADKYIKPLLDEIDKLIEMVDRKKIELYEFTLKKSKYINDCELNIKRIDRLKEVWIINYKIKNKDDLILYLNHSIDEITNYKKLLLLKNIGG